MAKITEDKNTIESIIRQAQICRIAFSDDGQPYIIPVSFGYEDNTIYFHCSKKGRKIDILTKNNAVCLEFDVDFELIKAEEACKWSLKYRSVIGFGKAYLVKDVESKRRALDAIMRQYSDEPYTYPETTLEKTGVVKIEIDSMTAKIAEK
jgi:nitroimidazol reductase NimA-like FMN-containing flavoprotein (pyridoxamine 5'-phosphate oxidase superfamily)